MLRAAVAGVALGLMALAVSAQSNPDCGEAYKSALEKLERERHAKNPPERIAALRRRAQRVYEACRTGDVQDVKALFDRLERLAQ
jgi:hypothetical protein